MYGVKQVLKFAERMNKRAATFLLRKTVRSHPCKFDPTSIKRVLFLRYDRLGDMIISTPLFRIMKQCYPHWLIGVLGTLHNVGVIEEDPNVDDIFLFRRNPLQLIRTLWRVRRVKYDVVMNLVFYKSLTGGLLAHILGPRAMKIAVDNEDLNFLYNHVVHIRGGPERHMLDRTLQLLEAFDIDPEEFDHHPHFFLGLTEREKAASFLSSHQAERGDSFFIGFNLTAGKPECRWALDRYARCGQRIREQYPHARIVLFTSPNEASAATSLQKSLSEYSRMCPPSACIREVSAVLEHMDLLVTPDTGMVHVASALNVPVVGLFTRLKSIPQSWGPYGVPNRVIIAPGREPVSAIDPEGVFQAVCDLIDEMKRNTIQTDQRLNLLKKAETIM